MTSVLAARDRVVAACVLGTDGRSLPPDDGPLADLLAPLRDGSPERGLLATVAILSAQVAAGHEPGRATVAEDLAPADDLPPADGSRRHLREILAGPHDGLLPEWCRAAAGAGRRVPGEWLPPLLNRLARAKGDDLPEPDVIARVLGGRGRWLAERNPAWRTLVAGEEDPVEAWETGAAHERLALLGRLRSRDPARARALLESTWEQETHRDRAAFVEALATGLSDEDEPLLEMALDDRRKPVRVVAADLLARRPASALVTRMRDRAEPLLDLRGRLRPKIAIELPDTPDRASVRDGVQPKPPAKSGLGERAWWLRQVLAAVPPSHWTERFGRSPRDLLAAARRSDWARAVIAGWVHATTRHRDPEWGEILLHVEEEELPRPGPDRGDLLRALPLDDRQAILARRIRAPASTSGLSFQDSFGFAHEEESAWSPELSEAILGVLEKQTRHTQFGRPSIGNPLDVRLLRLAGPRLHPSVHPLVVKTFRPHLLPGRPGAEELHELVTVLEFRHAMTKELSP